MWESFNNLTVTIRQYFPEAAWLWNDHKSQRKVTAEDTCSCNKNILSCVYLKSMTMLRGCTYCPKSISTISLISASMYSVCVYKLCIKNQLYCDEHLVSFPNHSPVLATCFQTFNELGTTQVSLLRKSYTKLRHLIMNKNASIDSSMVPSQAGWKIWFIYSECTK